MALNEGLLLLVVEMLGLLLIFGWLTAAETALRTLDRHRQKRLIDAGDAAALLRATGESLDQIRAAIALHASGEHDPDKHAFWDAVTNRVREDRPS